MQKENNNNNSRKAFLKKLPIAIIFVIGLAIFDFQKLNVFSPKNFKTLSKPEVDDIIKNLHSPKFKQLKPEPPPVRQVILDV